jgi:23S rRNA pseudouridine2605 synthase
MVGNDEAPLGLVETHVKRVYQHPSGRQTNQGKKVGLARALSKMGLCSRSRAFQLIQAGKVRLNGAVARNPEAPVRVGRDRIELGGKQVASAEKAYVVLHKPRGVVTTAADEKGRETVYSLLPAGSDWLAPVGRLDKASEGLLLFTNDSEWGARITDPESHLDKTYHVQINARAGAELIQALLSGVPTSEGENLRAKRAYILRSGEKNTWLELVLDEGKNRQIRRMLEAKKIEVLRIIRIGIGPLTLGELRKGATRLLTEEEKREIDQALGLERSR